MKPVKLIARRRKTKELNQCRARAVKTLLMKDCIAVYQKYGIRKVILFGSLTGKDFTQQSDVDIYVEPLDNEKYYEFQHALEHVLSRNVDLHTNKDDPFFVQKIVGRGEVIYEA